MEPTTLLEVATRLKQGLLVKATNGKYSDKDFREALIKSKCADWRVDFSSDEAEKSQEYFVYFKIFRQNQAEKPPSRRVRRFIQCFLKKDISVLSADQRIEKCFLHLLNI